MQEKLICRIRNFLVKYANISPNFDPNDDSSSKYTGPDPYQLEDAADLLERNIKPERVWSEWGSGCYRPYSDKEARKEHDEILEAIKNLK